MILSNISLPLKFLISTFRSTFKVKAESLIIRAFQYARKVQEQLIQSNRFHAIPDQGKYFRTDIHIRFNQSQNQTRSIVLEGHRWLQQVSTYHSISSLVTRQGEEH